MNNADKWNKYYQQDLDRIPWSKPRTKLIDFIIEKYKLEKGSEILEVGCATGATTLYLRKLGFLADGIDISSVAIEQAKQNTAKTAAQFNVVDISQYQKRGLMAERKYDLVLDLVTSQFLTDIEKETYVHNLQHTLKSDGALILYTYAKDNIDGNDLLNVRPFIKEVARTPKQIEQIYKDFIIINRTRKEKLNGEKLDLYLIRIK